jgi:hypothetical protein
MIVGSRYSHLNRSELVQILCRFLSYLPKCWFMPMIGQNDNLGGIVFTATRVILILSLAIIAIPTVAPAQSTASSASQLPGPEPLPLMPAVANPSFDVATIKPSDTSAPHGTFFRTNGRHVIAYNISVGGVIAYAYGLHEKQIVDVRHLSFPRISISMVCPISKAIPTSSSPGSCFRNCSSLVSS